MGLRKTERLGHNVAEEFYREDIDAKIT